MPKLVANMASTSKEIKYPSGCREINEELPTDDLIRRLKDIALAFQQMSQEEDNSSFVPLALYLSNDYFLEHVSKDVRLLVACAIADVFRVYAPNAPYQHPELIKHIFLFFIQQLRGLHDPKDATFKRYFYLLENLAWVKSFNICIELEDSQYIFCQLFSLIFKIVNENHSEKVKNFMLDMLTPLIIEADTVSSKLIEIILWQIIDPKKTQNKQAYWLATQILRKANKTMEPYLVTYFTNAITHGINDNAGEMSDEEDEEEMKPKQPVKASRGSKSAAATATTSVTQICELIYELNQICPNVMEGILPQLEFKVKSNEERERCEYTKLLARLFSDKNSNLADLYPELWRSFLGRFRDISVTVRMRCVQYSMHFLVNHPELRDDIKDQLRQRQHDPDENVRHEVVMAIISAAKKGIENINEDLLSFVKERTLDKKFKIRREALYGMAQLYKQYNVAALSENGEGDLDNFSQDSDTSNPSLRMLNWIKNKCLHNYYQTQLDDRLLVERILHTCLIPYSLPLAQRMKNLYTFYCTIDAHAARAFNELLRQQQSVRKQVKDVLDILREEKSEERDALLKQKIQLCAKNLPEPVKADEYITKLCRNLELNPALRQHMEMIVTSTSFPQMAEDGSPIPPPPSQTIEISVREVLKSLGFPVQTNSFYMIIKQLMERIAPIMVDHQGLLLLFNYVADSLLGDGEIDSQLAIDNSAKRGLQLIHSLSSVFPALFHGREIFTDYLLPFLWQSGDQHQVAEVVLQILTNIGAAAGTYSSSETNGHVMSLPWWATDEDVIPRLVDRFVIKASTTKQAKYAIQCLNAIISDENEKMKIFGEILDQIKISGLSLETSSYFRCHLVTIGMIAVCGGHAFFPKVLRSIIQKFIVQGLLMKDLRTDVEISTQEEMEKQRDNSDPNFAYEFCSEEIKSKFEGIKLMVRWIYGLKLNTLIASPENQQEAISNYQKNTNNTLQLLKTIIQNSGDLNEQNRVGTTLEKAYLRLASALAMLKIACNDAITAVTGQGDNNALLPNTPNNSILQAQQWHTLATVLLDTEEFVKEKFCLKLHKGLLSLALGHEFLAVLALGGTFDNGSPFKNKLRSYLHLNLAKRRDLIKSKSVVNIKSVMPDCVMPYVIHLLAHMPFYTQYDDISQLEIVKECLWFIMEPLVLKNEHYSFSFFKKTFENIKTCVDRISSQTQETDPNVPVGTTIATMTNYKIYCACDLALGLVMSKTQNFLLKDFPVQPSLPGKYFTVSPSAADNNFKCYLPNEMQFAPPKRCGLEAEILNKITKSFQHQSAQQMQQAPQRGRPAKTVPQQQSQVKQQIVVITGENVVEEGVIIEQEDQNQLQEQNQAQQRTRKQQIEVIADEEANDERVNKRSKTAVSESAGGSRVTRSNSKPDVVKVNVVVESETPAAGSHETESATKIETSVSEEQESEADSNQQKRRPGRPPKNPAPAPPVAAAASAPTSDDDSSPQRKSARLANKSTPGEQSAPVESEASASVTRGRGRGRGRALRR